MKLLVSALEPSSNEHLKELLKHLPQDMELYGIFDKSIANPLFDMSSIAIMGIVDAIKKISFLLKLQKQMIDLAKDIDTVLLMDSSGFNLPLAKKIKKQYPNKTIIYYILPQAWAWRRGRIKSIEAYCDHLCSILPFERDFYTQKDKISYVGHPLLDKITNFKNSTTTNNIIAFMAGSRKSEITKLMPIFKELASHLKDKKLILIIPPKFDDDFIQKTYGDISDFKISHDAHKSLYEADFAFICSGTATLEASIIGTPFVLSYIAKKFDFFVGSVFLKVKFVGLANIFYDFMHKGKLHEELLQDEVNVQNLLEIYHNTKPDTFLQSSLEVRKYLKYGSSKQVAKIISATTL